MPYLSALRGLRDKDLVTDIDAAWQCMTCSLRNPFEADMIKASMRIANNRTAELKNVP